MTKTLRNKLIGTSVFALFIGVLAVGVFGLDAQGKFISQNNALLFDGIVIEKNPDDLTLATSGGFVKVLVDNNTIVLPGFNYQNIQVGDGLNIAADPDYPNFPMAELIKPSYIGPGYGIPGDQVVFHNAVVADVGPTSFIAYNEAAVLLFEVLTSTEFIGVEFGLLQPGDEITIIGEDSGAAFVARQVLSTE